MSTSSNIDRFVTAVERRVNWKPLWASRLLGCTVGLLRVIEWTPAWTLPVAWAMWQARYWVATMPEARR